MRWAVLLPGAALLAACHAGFPYMGHPKFSFDYPAGWTGPVSIDDGVRFQPPGSRAKIDAAYHPVGSKAYRTPTAFKQFMREQGGVSDSHIIDQVVLGTTTASRVFFTTYEYDPRYAMGAKKEVLYTELFMVPDPGGIFVLSFEAPRAAYRKFRRDLETVLRTIILAEPAP